MNYNYWLIDNNALQSFTKEFILNEKVYSQNFNDINDNQLMNYSIIDNIAILPIEGTILKGVGLYKYLKVVDVDIFKNTLSVLGSDNQIKSIIMLCDSPGGTLPGVKEAAEHVNLIQKTKKIYAHTSGYIASGMYWIASAATEICATETAQIGSIGVIYTHFDFSKNNEKMGLKVYEIASGKWKALYSQDENFIEEKKEKIQKKVNDIASIFFKDVAKYRNVSIEQIEALEAEIYLAEEAKKKKLIDRIESYESLLARITNKNENERFKIMSVKIESKQGQDEFESKQVQDEFVSKQNQNELVSKQNQNELVSKQGQEKEKNRILTILQRCKLANLPDDFFNSLIDTDISIEEATIKIFNQIERNQPVIQTRNTNVDLELDETDKFRSSIINGISLRLGLTDKEEFGGKEFKSLSLSEIGKRILTKRGVHNANSLSKNQVASKLFSVSMGASSSDFPFILGNIVNKRLIKTYNESPSTFKPFVRVVSATDFKDITGLKLSESPNLELINESGEYKTGEFAENQERYVVKTYGLVTYLTRKMIINDDLRAFDRISQLFGAAAKRKEGDIVYSLINNNPPMQDGHNLFSDVHKNDAKTASVITTNAISTGRAAMRKQKGIQGNAYLDITPEFLLTPVEMETDAEVLLRSISIVDDNKNSGVINPFNGKLKPISDPRLSDTSTTAWYLIANPSQTETIEVAFLDGEEQPYTEEDAIFDRDGIGIKIRHDFGAGIMDYTGFYRNTGV